MNKSILYIRILVLVLFSTSLLSLDAQDWNLHKDYDGIEVYTRKIDGFDIKDVRIRTKLQTSMQELIAALEDFGLQDSWVKNTNESRKIEQITPTHYFFYIGTDFPFPAKDRDAVIEYKRSLDAENNNVFIEYKAHPDRMPKASDYIRMPSLDATYTLTPLEQGWIDVDYFIRADIGGSIPNWIINLAISKGPKDTMVALKKVLASGQYAGTQVSGLEGL